MQALRKVLERYSESHLTMGARKGAEATTTIRREDLQRELRQVNLRNEKYFMVGVAMAMVLFVALVVTAFLQRSGTLVSQAIPPVLGSSAAVVVWRMFRIWREKSYTDCVLALVPNVDDEMLKTIVGVLVKKI